MTAGATLAPEHALCFLPLPWSVELAARLAAAGRPHGVRLGGWPADTIGAAVHRQLRASARSGDRALASGAAHLLAVLPALPAQRTCLQVLGRLRLSRDGVQIDAPELRRGRVRQLLSALVLRPSLTRDQAIDLLWPELDQAKAAGNIRVTLTHLRRLLEPDRLGGDASYHLRTTGDTIRLVASDALTVDLWTFDKLTAQARRARLAGDIDRAADLLSEAIELFDGDPLPDIADLPAPDIAAQVAALRTRYVEHLLELGELRLVSDDPATAFTLAERALTDEPFDPRGHRLLLAAALRGRSPVRIAAARRVVGAALRELGVAPDPATAILLRQASPTPLNRGHPRMPARSAVPAGERTG